MQLDTQDVERFYAIWKPLILFVNRRLRLDTSTLIPLIVVNLLFTFTVRGISIPGHVGGLIVGGIVKAILAGALAPGLWRLVK